MRSILYYTLFYLLLIIKPYDFVQKLNVAVYYETLCADSIQFINEQLYPSWTELGSYLDLHLIPFGKSRSINGGQNFICQHGPQECIGNKLQSCALSGLSSTDKKVYFTHCFMNSFMREDMGQLCAAQFGLTWNFIEHCYNSNTGTILQLQAEIATRNVNPKYVPTIIYNGVFTQEDQDASLTNFKAVVCKFLNRVPACEQNYTIQIER